MIAIKFFQIDIFNFQWQPIFYVSIYIYWSWCFTLFHTWLLHSCFLLQKKKRLDNFTQLYSVILTSFWIFLSEKFYKVIYSFVLHFNLSKILVYYVFFLNSLNLHCRLSFISFALNSFFLKSSFSLSKP